MQAHELGIVSVVVDLGNGKSTTTAELRRKEDAKYGYISIVAVTMFMAFHLPRVVPNIVELVSPEAAKQNVSSFFKWCGTLKDTLGQLKNSKSLKFLSKIKFLANSLSLSLSLSFYLSASHFKQFSYGKPVTYIVGC